MAAALPAQIDMTNADRADQQRGLTFAASVKPSSLT